MTVVPLLTLNTLDDDEMRLVDQLQGRLAVYEGANRDAVAYYEGTQTVEQFGISIPPSMRNLEVVAGWGGTVVDVLEERLDWLGWTSEGDDFGLAQIYADNALDVEAGMAHLDALIFGTSFVAVGSGADGEPSPLITPFSPRRMTGLWDARTRRLSAALTVTYAEGGTLSEATLYRPNETVTIESRNGMLVVVERDQHNLDRVPIVKMPNRIRASREAGRSEITKAVRYYTDAAVRTLLGLEVNREFYNAPQRVGLNIPEDAFTDASGNALSQWSAIMGRVWMLPPNEDDGPEPDVKQFNPSSPAPYLDQVRGYATLLAAEAGIPTDYLGIQTSNPSSADAIRAGEARLVKRAERRQVTFGRAWLEVARLALMVRDGGEVPPALANITTRWRDAATPTRAAAADEALKLTQGDNPILPADSTVTYDRIGLSPAEQRQVQADKRRAAGRGVLDALRTAANGAGDAQA